jgi:type III restriction enzyme
MNQFARLVNQGLRIGVVVDEAHHGFHGKTQAAYFFSSLLKPEYTILITATPDDRDLEDLQKKMHLGEAHRISISRHGAVESGLVKTGVYCITWEAMDNEKKALVDFDCLARSCEDPPRD